MREIEWQRLYTSPATQFHRMPLQQMQTWNCEGVIMRNTTLCSLIRLRATSGSLMSSAGATTMPQPIENGSHTSITLPSKMNGMVWKNMDPGGICAVAVR
jgi:hypothetical protein